MNTRRTSRGCRRARDTAATARSAAGRASAAAFKPRKLRCAIERQMQLRGQAPRAQVIDAAHEAGIQVRAAEQLQEGRLRVGARNHGPAPRCARRIRARRPPRDPPRPESAPPAPRCESRRRPRAPLSRAHRTTRPLRPGVATSAAAPPAASAARRYSSVSTVPGERGPKFVPSTASKPSAPLSAGDSKCSSSRS